MKTYQCQCGQRLFFENTHCNGCQTELGYLPDQQVLTPIANNKRYQKCINYSKENVCNWMVLADGPHDYCVSCRLNYVIPDLSRTNNRFYWYRLEQAKRRLLYSLFALGLPVVGRDQDAEHGLRFSFLEDAPVFRESGSVITGHAAGMITINVAEADDAAREAMRNQMNEPYRTLLGHFRHESGHYYWDRLIKNTPHMEVFRTLFGDESQDYDQALEKYYKAGAPSNWQQHYISAYATSHPWEDWAESWAHYLHLLDTLETAHDFGLTAEGVASKSLDVYAEDLQFNHILDDWSALSVAMNSICRSMGLNDFYPFHISDSVVDKLFFIHQVVQQQNH